MQDPRAVQGMDTAAYDDAKNHVAFKYLQCPSHNSRVPADKDYSIIKEMAEAPKKPFECLFLFQDHQAEASLLIVDWRL